MPTSFCLDSWLQHHWVLKLKLQVGYSSLDLQAPLFRNEYSCILDGIMKRPALGSSDSLVINQGGMSLNGLMLR